MDHTAFTLQAQHAGLSLANLHQTAPPWVVVATADCLPI